MGKPLAVILPFVAVFLGLAVFNLGVSTVFREASNQPAVFPTVAPLQSPLCGKNNRDCTFDYDWQKTPPFKGLTLTDPPR
jgi:hypothetical protein